MEQVLANEQTAINNPIEERALRLVSYWLDDGDGSIALIPDASWTPEELVLRWVNEGGLPDIRNAEIKASLRSMCVAIDNICVLLEVEYEKFLEAARQFELVG